MRHARAARARSTHGPIASTTASTSACVEVWPSENRSECRAASSVQPIASSTWEGWGTPAEQAEPVEHSIPRASSSISSESPSQPGKPRWALPGSRPLGVAVQVGVGHDLDDPAHQVVAQRADPGGVLGLVLDGELDGGGEARDRRRVDGAAADVALLSPAVRQRGHVDLAAYDERADAVRAADLVAGQGQRVDAGLGEVDRHRADRLHRVGVDRDPWAAAIATTSSIGWRVPTSLLAHITEIRATDSGSRSTEAAERVEVEAAALVDREQLDVGALGLAQPAERIEHGVVLDRSSTGSGYGAGRRRAATSRCP